MRAELSVALTVVALGAANLNVGPAQAQSVAEFYKDKTVTMIIGGSAGGGFDTLARGIARHIGKHIPGNPFVMPRNMSGAGGLLAMDHLYNIIAPMRGSASQPMIRGSASQPMINASS
jgi:tripartite-type tricarboxylate transporter receptor subunit TctC